jgi:hypothetical protein
VFKVPTRLLLIIGGCVWIIAGANICIIGLQSGAGIWNWLLLVGMVVIFALFLAMFLAITRKHAKRILGYTEPRTNLFKFFDVKSYIIMVFMIALGLTLRLGRLVPLWFIAFFYTGLGAALIIAGASQFVAFAKSRTRAVQ